jgi:hypothetical protein
MTLVDFKKIDNSSVDFKEYNSEEENGNKNINCFSRIKPFKFKYN